MREHSSQQSPKLSPGWVAITVPPVSSVFASGPEKLASHPDVAGVVDGAGGEFDGGGGGLWT